MPTPRRPRRPFSEGDRVEVSEHSPFGAGLVGRVVMANETFVAVIGKRWDHPAQPVEQAIVSVKRCKLLEDATPGELPLLELIHGADEGEGVIAAGPVREDEAGREREGVAPRLFAPGSFRKGRARRGVRRVPGAGD